MASEPLENFFSKIDVFRADMINLSMEPRDLVLNRLELQGRAYRPNRKVYKNRRKLTILSHFQASKRLVSQIA